MTAMPSTEAEVADFVRDAAGQGRRISVRGGGTRSVDASADLSTSALAGIVDYQPAEMVMIARAGTTMRDVESALAAAGQMLPFEPMDHRPLLGTMGEPTIGGVFAANVSGSRRFVAGAARDCLLGIRFVNGAGEVIRAGGRVMKNVTGLDLVKLLAGSRGTLGVITEVTFRVLPKPASARTLLVAGLDDAEAARAMAAAMATTFDVSGAAHLPAPAAAALGLGGEAATLLRLEGRPSAVAARADGLRKVVGGHHRIDMLDDERTAEAWRRIANAEIFAADDRPVWRASVAPVAGHQLVERLACDQQLDAFYDWQGGFVWMRPDSSLDPATVQQSLKGIGGGHAHAVRAPRPDPQHVSAQPAVNALSAVIKSKLDPRGIFGRATGEAA